MKILCLHGCGTSSAILKSQLDALICRADESYEFIYLNGEVECSKAKGLGNFVRGPFLCYNSDFSPSSVRSSCKLLDNIIEEEGPVDGILGFSQGGSLALSYLLRHEIESPDDLPPFRFTILLSTVIAFSPSKDVADDVLNTLTPSNLSALQSFPSEITEFVSLTDPANDARKFAFITTLAKAFESAQKGEFIASDTEAGTFAPSFNRAVIPRVVYPSLIPQRIRVPTVYITGQKDDPAIVELSKLM